MIVSVTQFKARCSEIVREVERDRKVVEIARRGKIVARLLPATPADVTNTTPCERLRGTGELLATPEESMLEECEFRALR